MRPATIHRWIRERSGNKKKQPKRGRPRIVEQIETRIRKLGKNSRWGYTRILGELKKLGIERYALLNGRTKCVKIKRRGYFVPRKKWTWPTGVESFLIMADNSSSTGIVANEVA